MGRLRGLLGPALVMAWTSIVPVQAQERFVVEDIRLEGLQRISAGTVFNYLPVEVGDTVGRPLAAEAIRALYQTGFFQDVAVGRDDGTLVVSLEERPSIAEIRFSGNDSVDTDDLLESLEQVGFAEGRAFNEATFEQVAQELKRTYFGLGKYSVDIESSVTPLERNRAAVRFDISEGQEATIKQINIVGNTVFDDEELLQQFALKTSTWWRLFTSPDRYSRQELAADLERLRSYYLDRGYINFSVDSAQVSVTPDKKDVYITINVSEGNQYTVEDIKLAGELIAPKEELFGLIQVRRGEVFSRKNITETTQQLTERLGDDGYAFANVNAVPDIDESNKTVSLTFFVDPGKRAYVRRINFSGNTKTRDEVLRREMRLAEGGWIDTSAVERSKERLERLGYFEAVNVETPAVAGTADQVDVNFDVVEAPSGSLLAGLGFSQTQGVVFNTSVSQENFLGTGNRVGVDFNNSQVNRVFGFSFLDPYWTIDGISRGYRVKYEETDAESANVSDFTLDELSANINFGVPISEFDTVDVGATIERAEFEPGDGASVEILDFERENGDTFANLVFNASFSRDLRNSRLLPDRGTLNRFSGEASVPGSDLEYWKLSYKHQRFIPLLQNYTLMLEGEFAFGDGFGDTEDLPLTDNFFAGGIRSVRGFEGNTLGPRDSQDDPLGGDTKLVGSAEVILPVPFAVNVRQFRMTAFFDAGNVYGPDEDIELSELRYSTGLSMVWLSPFGAITVSGAVPLNDESEDDTQPIQFTLGTSF